jgi:hypothetical protein
VIKGETMELTDRVTLMMTELKDLSENYLPSINDVNSKEVVGCCNNNLMIDYMRLKKNGALELIKKSKIRVTKEYKKAIIKLEDAIDSVLEIYSNKNFKTIKTKVDTAIDKKEYDKDLDSSLRYCIKKEDKISKILKLGIDAVFPLIYDENKGLYHARDELLRTKEESEDKYMYLKEEITSLYSVLNTINESIESSHAKPEQLPKFNKGLNDLKREITNKELEVNKINSDIEDYKLEITKNNSLIQLYEIMYTTGLNIYNRMRSEIKVMESFQMTLPVLKHTAEIISRGLIKDYDVDTENLVEKYRTVNFAGIGSQRYAN